MCYCVLYVVQTFIHVTFAMLLVLQPAYRELISVLLSDMYGTLVNSKEMMKGITTECCLMQLVCNTRNVFFFPIGFDVLLEEVEDLKLDTPDAGEVNNLALLLQYILQLNFNFTGIG